MAKFRPLWLEQFEQRLLLTAGVSPVLEAMPIAQIRLELSDLGGQPISSLQAGEEFFLNAYVADVRSEPKGVFAAYFDLAFDAERVVPAGNMEFSSVYKNGLVTGGTASGLLDEVGAFSGSYRPIGAGDFLLFRAPFRAEAAGTVSFLAEPASLPGSEVLLYGAGGPLSSDEIRFGSVSLNVLGPGNSSQDLFVSPAPGSFVIGNSGPPLLGDFGSPEVLGSPPSSLLTGTDHDLLHRSTTSMLNNRNPVTLLADRAWDSQTQFNLLNEGFVLTDEFNFAPRPQSVAPEWHDRGLFSELSVWLPTGRSFSVMSTPDFLPDEYDARPGRGRAAGDRIDAPAGWSSLFHDHQWLTAGILRIGWTTELGRGKDADIADDAEMFDLSQIAYETIKTSRLHNSAPPRIDRDEDDDDEWIASLDEVFSEETEIEGLQGSMMAMEVDLPNKMPARQEAASRTHSDDAVPTDSRSNKRAEDDSERKPHDDTTPAA